jgi:hypothetical protein
MHRRMLGDYTADRTRTELDAELTENGDTLLTDTEFDVAEEIKTHHDGLVPAAARDFRDTFPHRVLLVRAGRITRETFRTEVGIISE